MSGGELPRVKRRTKFPPILTHPSLTARITPTQKVIEPELLSYMPLLFVYM